MAAKEEVAACSQAWLKRKGHEDEQSWRARKKHRRGAAQWLAALDASLASGAGWTLKDIQQPVEMADRGDSLLWRSLSVAADMKAAYFQSLEASSEIPQFLVRDFDGHRPRRHDQH